jgi:hypothetical protein
MRDRQQAHWRFMGARDFERRQELALLAALSVG